MIISKNRFSIDMKKMRKEVFIGKKIIKTERHTFSQSSTVLSICSSAQVSHFLAIAVVILASFRGLRARRSALK
jgi:hypothetical protein